MNREDLKRYRSNDEWIKGQMEYIMRQKEQVNKLTSTLSDMPFGGKEVQDSMAEKLTKLMDNLNDLLEQILKEAEFQKKILERLNTMEPQYKNLLHKLYIEGKTLVKVADEKGYTYETVCRKHGIALNIFEKNESSH